MSYHFSYLNCILFLVYIGLWANLVVRVFWSGTGLHGVTLIWGSVHVLLYRALELGLPEYIIWVALA